MNEAALLPVPRMTFGSLFAGIGGMDLGLERAGMTCKWQVEIDPYARRVLAKHWPDVRRWDDVRTFPPDVADADGDAITEPHLCATEPEQPIPRRHDAGRRGDLGEWSVDLIAGGFPCQDISFAGKGAGLAGERSGLWFEFARVLRVLRPRYVLVENVSALLVRGLDSVLGTLASIGYDAEWFCLPAAAVGAPHIRDRVFIVANSGCERVQPERDARVVGCQASSAEGEQEERQRGGSRFGDRGPAIPHPHRSRLAQRECFGRNARSELAAFERANRQAGGQWGFDPAEDPQSGVGRVAARFPHRMDRLRGLGNAVVPQVAEFIGRRILEFDKEEHDS
jgi:DNA (cytosine-5)-methyltransferase 1